MPSNNFSIDIWEIHTKFQISNPTAGTTGKRGIIETIIDQLKNISQIEHSRHRSPINFLVNLFAGLIAYSLQPKKPSLNLSGKELSIFKIS